MTEPTATHNEWSLAFHEAAHAIVNTICGLEVVRVRINRSSGVCEHRGAADPWSQALVSLAGIAAEEKLGLYCDWDGLPQAVWRSRAIEDHWHWFEVTTSDKRQVKHYLLKEDFVRHGDHRLRVDRERFLETIRSLQDETYALLSRRDVWSAVERLASRLIEKRTCGPEDVAESLSLMRKAA